ncbi:MAG: alpha-amylase family glycosyl hydrolase [Actinomycetota bacterium]
MTAPAQPSREMVPTSTMPDDRATDDRASNDQASKTVAERIERHLGRLYTGRSNDELGAIRRNIVDAFALDGDRPFVGRRGLPDQSETVLITYGDSIRRAGADAHLQALQELVAERFADIIGTVHILPFFTSSSDGGFSIVDYRQVADGLGDWTDVSAIAADRGLMVDLVCNHGSAQSAWFQGFLADQEPYRNWYTTADPAADLSTVVRPRTHPLLLEVETPSGPRHVWATFSHDQVDFDFANPDVLVEFCSIVRSYIANGATRIRLDAIAYLWKELGTPCVHLPQTHEVVRLFRTLVDALDEQVLLITETNVPHVQNVAYFGDGDEAQVVYNFTLAPLIVWSCLAERAAELTGWLGRLTPLPDGCTFLNFIASHDGIGLRPIEDLVDADELEVLLDRARETGGDWSFYSAPGGPRPYELNVSLADLLAGSDGSTWSRFVAAHAVMLAVQGLPAFYVHSLLSTPGDLDAVARTQHKRDINRVSLDRELVDERLADGWRADVFASLAHLIRIRRGQPAFAPTADQIVHVLGESVVAIERVAPGQRLLALTNLRSEPAAVDLPDWAGRHDLVAGCDRAPGEPLVLEPWASSWLV